MKIQYHKIALVAIIAAQVLFAQETDDEEEPELLPAIAAALPKPMSVAQALSGSGLPSGCTADFTSVFEKDDFDMAEFMKELPLAVAKVKLQLKSPFGKPQDSDRTDVGLSVGCIKALPESPVEIASLLKNISLKMGLDLAVDAAENLADNSVPAKKKSSVSFGIRGGINFSHTYAVYRIYNKNTYNRALAGSGSGNYADVLAWQAGFVVDFAVNDWLHIQPGLMYIAKGMNDGIDRDDYNHGDITHNLELPLLLSFKLAALRLNAGPYFALCLSNANLGYSYQRYGSDIDDSLDRGVFDYDVGLSMGIGFDIQMFYIGMFYDFGFADVSHKSGYNYYNRTLGFNVGINL